MIVLDLKNVPECTLDALGHVLISGDVKALDRFDLLGIDVHMDPENEVSNAY